MSDLSSYWHQTCLPFLLIGVALEGIDMKGLNLLFPQSFLIPTYLSHHAECKSSVYT